MVEPTILGLTKRYSSNKKHKSVLPFRSHLPPGGYVEPPRPTPTEWYHSASQGFEPAWYKDCGPRTLNVDYMCLLANKHFEADLAAYACSSYHHGFLDHCTAPPYTQALTANTVQPGDPGSEEIGNQLLRVAMRGKLWCSRLPVAGTQLLAASMVQKTKPNGDIKNRPVLKGNYPGKLLEEFSRKGHTPRSHVSYSQESIVHQMACYVRHPPDVAILADLANAFETLNKHPHQINSNCVHWDPGDAMWSKLMKHVKWTGPGEQTPGGPCYFYSGVHLFGLSATPFHANLSFGLIALEQQEIALRLDPWAKLCRRTDDTLVTFTEGFTAEQIQTVAERMFEVNAWSGHLLQHTKTRIGIVDPLFDGFCFDFVEQRIGLPADKGLKIFKIMQGFLGSNTHLQTREIAESLQGKLEHAAQAVPTILKFLVAFRKSWMLETDDKDLVTLTLEAASDLRRLCGLLKSQQYTLWTNFAQHFIDGTPSIIFATDASGLSNKGYGGYVLPDFKGDAGFFCVDSKWRHIVADTDCIEHDKHSSGLLEFIAAWAMVELSDWKDETLLWRTDSKVARDAWRKGRSESILLNRVIKHLAYALANARCVLVVEHLSRDTHTITLADMLSRQFRSQFQAGILAMGLSRRLETADFRCPGVGLRNRISRLLSAESI